MSTAPRTARRRVLAASAAAGAFGFIMLAGRGDGADHRERTKGRLMKATRIMAIAALIATTGLALHVGQAQQVGARRIDLQRHDLSVTGREVVQTIVELAPGTTAPRHTHPGEEIIYVLEGTWEYTVEGKPPVTLKTGDVLFNPSGAIHSARNVGTGRALGSIGPKGMSRPLVALQALSFDPPPVDSRPEHFKRRRSAAWP